MQCFTLSLGCGVHIFSNSTAVDPVWSWRTIACLGIRTEESNNLVTKLLIRVIILLVALLKGFFPFSFRRWHATKNLYPMSDHFIQHYLEDCKYYFFCSALESRKEVLRTPALKIQVICKVLRNYTWISWSILYVQEVLYYLMEKSSTYMCPCVCMCVCVSTESEILMIYMS